MIALDYNQHVLIVCKECALSKRVFQVLLVGTHLILTLFSHIYLSHLNGRKAWARLYLRNRVRKGYILVFSYKLLLYKLKLSMDAWINEQSQTFSNLSPIPIL